MTKCEIKKCGENMALIYYNHLVCDKHWSEHCANKINLKEIFEVS